MGERMTRAEGMAWVKMWRQERTRGFWVPPGLAGGCGARQGCWEVTRQACLTVWPRFSQWLGSWLAAPPLKMPGRNGIWPLRHEVSLCGGRR